jgi:DNA-binding transcriptional MerR regulator
LTIGAVAEHFGVLAWQVRRLFERGILPPAARVGHRVVDQTGLPKIETALRQAGYLESHEEASSRQKAASQAVAT